MIVHYWEKQREHIVALCRKHKVTLNEDCDCVRKSCSRIETREIWVPQINCGEAYVAALHELGHIVYKRANPANYPSFCGFSYAFFHIFSHVLHTESAAWEFALRHSNVPFGDDLIAFCCDVFNSYVRNRKKWGAKIPNNKTYKLLVERKLHTLWA